MITVSLHEATLRLRTAVALHQSYMVRLHKQRTVSRLTRLTEATLSSLWGASPTTCVTSL